MTKWKDEKEEKLYLLVKQLNKRFLDL